MPYTPTGGYYTKGAHKGMLKKRALDRLMENVRRGTDRIMRGDVRPKSPRRNPSIRDVQREPYSAPTGRIVPHSTKEIVIKVCRAEGSSISEYLKDVRKLQNEILAMMKSDGVGSTIERVEIMNRVGR